MVEVEDTPMSPPGVAETRVYEGFEAGNGTFGWAPSVSEPLHTLYMSFWFRIADDYYETNNVLQKIIYIRRGLPENRQNAVFSLTGSGFGQAYTQIPTITTGLATIHPDGTFGSSPNRSPNVDSLPQIVAGRWHHAEVLLIVNDITDDGWEENGVIRIWVNDNLLFEDEEAAFRSHVNPGVIHTIDPNMIWGGVGTTKMRDDVIQFDHFYYSGLPEPE